MTFRIPFRKIIVVIALSTINGLNAITRISSLLFVATIDRFHVDREKASFPYALRLVVEPLAGPFVGYLACMIGFRPVVILGGIIASTAFAACFFAEDILTICILYGGIFGIGLSMARDLLPSVIDVNFKKDIALINGLALFGSSLGGLLIPPLFDVTLDKYGLSGSFLILGAILLHSLPAGMLLWTPKSAKKKTDEQNSKTISEVDALSSCSKQVKIGAHDTDEIPIHSIPALHLPNTESANFMNDVCVETVFKDMSSKQIEVIFVSKNDDTKLKRKNKESCIKSSDIHTNITPEQPEISNEKETTERRNREIMLRIHNLPITNENTMQTEKDDKRTTPTKSSSKCLKNKKKNAFPEIISLLWDPLFILVTTSQSLLKTVYIIFVLIFMDFARDVGILRNQAIYLVMCMSATDFVGRLGLAWIPDRGYMSIERFFSLSLTVQAASLVVISFWNEFAVMFSAIFVFGLATSGLSLVAPGIVSKYFEGNRKTTAMASRFFLCGPMSLTISPLIGFFRIRLGSYIGLIYLIIACLLLCAVSQLLLPIIASGSNNKEKAKTTDINIPIERII